MDAKDKGGTLTIDVSSKAKLQESLTGVVGKIDTLGRNYDEVLERLGAAEGDRAETKKGLTDLRTLIGDMGRVRVHEGSEKSRLPVTSEAYVAFGMKALHDAPSKVETSHFGWGTLFTIDEDNAIEAWKKAGDDVRIVAMRMGIRDPWKIRELKTFKAYVEKAQAVATMVKEAFNIQNAGEGLDWLATDMSEQLIEMIRVERRLAKEFQEVEMRHGKLTFPTWLTDLQAFLMTENTSASASTPAIGDGLNTRDITSKYELSAKAVGVAITMTKFLIEDSAIDELPWARSAIVETLGEAEEDMILNGDSTATHMDADIEAVTDHPAQAFPGLRYVATRTANQARVSAGGNRLDRDDNIRDYLLRVLGKMDKYGVNPDKVLCLTGPQGNSQLLSVQAWLTSYAASQATNTSGRVPPTPFGWRYCVSSKQRANLDSTGVNTSGTTTWDKTSTELVYIPAWRLGKVREVTLQLLDQTRAKQDQIEIIGTMREAFGSPYKTDGTEPHVGQVYDQGV